MTPTADSYVDASSSASNFGGLTQVRIDGSPLVRTFLRFSVTSVGGTVKSAVLRVFANSAQTLGYDVYSVADSTWGETTITAANAPPFAATKLGSSGKITAGSWTSVDVTSAVTGNGTFSFGLSTTSGTAVSLSSREGANPAQLVISWTSSGSIVAPPWPSRQAPWLAIGCLLLPVLALRRLLLDRLPVRELLTAGPPAGAVNRAVHGT